MKKVIAIFGALAITAGMTFAQNNNATSTQTGIINEAEILQTGMENTATTNQVGDRNDAGILQGNFGGGNVQSNYAEGSIDQEGDDNTAQVNQRQGWSGGTDVSIHSVEQVGDFNVGLLTTFNGGNFGSVEQIGNDNYANGRQANGPNNDLEIYQQGNDNDADVWQGSGSNNTAVIMQGGDIGGDVNNNNGIARIDQRGSYNDATIQQRQGWNGGTNVSNHSIDQLGDDNYAVFTTFNGGNTGTIDQEGDENWASGRQSVGSGNNIDIAQNGLDNYAKVEQISSTNSSALITQIGNENFANVTQKNVNPLGEVGHKAEIAQEGNGNQTTLTQGLINDDGSSYKEKTTGNDNVVIAEQGHYAQMRLDVTGDDNEVTSRQERVGFASIKIEGSDNEFGLNQLTGSGFLGANIDGDENTITVMQDGSGNDIMQDGSGWWQRDGILINGDLNTVGITQMGNDHRANVSIMGDGNTSTVTQNN